MMYQTYLKDCDCRNAGIIIHEGIAVCRWCRTPYGKGGNINYEEEHFQYKAIQRDIPKNDWYVLSFRSKADHSLIWVWEFNFYECPNGSRGFPKFTILDFLNKTSSIQIDIEIKSVIRLSDNEVFSVGDEVAIREGVTHKWFGKIFEFKILGKDLIIGIWQDGETSSTGSLHRTITDIEKVKPKVPLFTTEDGYICYEGCYTIIWVVDSDFSMFSNFATDMFGKYSERKYFHDKEKAKEYILNNKHIQVSYKDYNDYRDMILSKQNTITFEDLMKGFFKSKITP